MNLLTLARRTPADTYVNRCRSHLTDTARCYRDIGHDGEHLWITDKCIPVWWP